ncbi:hypothetical protein [Streptomyces sp. NPDC048445]|uniref:hypothetical protein n=1 Tax=Streptomyces sp. NPDC048445 TaxID=3365553 RepID=UPI00371383C6
MSGEAFAFNEDSDEVVPEEWPTFYTPVPVWVLLCGCTAQAYRMYAFLAEHINNRTPGKRIAFPSQKAVAKAMVLKDYRDVAKYREELAALGAIRFQEFRYAGGMRRRYRYWVRFNPPEGYTGLLSLTDFYEANPDVKAKKSKPIKDKAQEVSAGQPGGGKNPTSGSGEKPTSQGGKSPTAQQLDQVQPDPVQEEDGDAPSGRSPVDGVALQAEVVGPEAEGGCAASGKTAPSPTPHDDTRRPARNDKGSSKKAAHTREQLDVVRRVRALFPPELLDNGLPDLPALSSAILTAMDEGRTVEQMGERIWYRWSNHGFADIWAESHRFEKPVGVAIALVQPLRRGDRFACPDPRCENGQDIDTKVPCRLCAVRDADQKAERARARGQKAAGGSNAASVAAGSSGAALPPQRPVQPRVLLKDCGNDRCSASIVVTAGPLCRDCEAAAAERHDLENAGAPAPF